jgi:hypothetical protein
LKSGGAPRRDSPPRNRQSAVEGIHNLPVRNLPVKEFKDRRMRRTTKEHEPHEKGRTKKKTEKLGAEK